MQFESLKIFCDVARHRSFSRAAQANSVTQSAASQVVHQLELRLGDVQLINRATRPLQLTALGQDYYEGCKGLVEQYLELEASIKKSHAEMAATVAVAAIYSVGLGDMGHYIERFKAVQPGARVHIEYLHPDRVYDKVLEGASDFGLVSFPKKTRSLEFIPWRDEEMVLACAPAHPLAQRKHVRPADLAGLAYVGFDRNLTIRREVDRFLREQGVTVDVVLEFDNIENIKKAVEISAGVALLPAPTLRHEVEAGTLVALPLSGARLTRPLGIIRHRHRKLGASALRFLELLRDRNEAHFAAPPGERESRPASPRFASAAAKFVNGRAVKKKKTNLAKV